jgi:ribosomal protein S6
MARGQKSFQHLNKTLVNDDEIYMMVMLYTYQHKSLEYLARKFNISPSVVKEIIIRSRFGGTCG